MCSFYYSEETADESQAMELNEKGSFLSKRQAQSTKDI